MRCVKRSSWEAYLGQSRKLEFPPLINYKYHDCNSQHAVRDFFGNPGFGRESPADSDILDVPASSFPITTERIGNEADVRRFFDRFVSGTVTMAFAPWKIEERAETGLVGVTQITGTVDCRYTIANQAYW